jgi:hypothetical protein
MTRSSAETIASDSLFCEADEQMDRIKKRLLARETLGLEHSEIERLLQTEGNELIRMLLQSHLDLRAMLEKPVDVVGADGVDRSQGRASVRNLETVFGGVRVPRQLYQAPGVEGLAPIDATLNLPAELYSHELRRVVAEESSRGSYDEVVELIGKRTGAEVAKRQVEELAVRAARDFDGFYRERAVTAEATADLLILSFDGKGIAMRHEDLREATRKAAEKTPNKLQTRLASGEKPNRKRMAQVAAIYTIAPWVRTVADILHTLRADDVEDRRPRPVQKRVWASVAHTSQRVIDDAFAEALRRDPERRRRWVVLVDGHPDQLRRIQKAIRATKVKATIVLDIVHVLEYLWRAAYAFNAPGSVDAETWVRNRLLAVLTTRSASTVARSICLMVERHSLSGKAASAVHDCAAYLIATAKWQRYSAALADGLPIATGVIEGACRYLVQDRMGRTGARWSLAGAEAILRLRALRASGDFDAYWAFHLAKERGRNHGSRYENAAPPNPLPSPRPALKLVK